MLRRITTGLIALTGVTGAVTIYAQAEACRAVSPACYGTGLVPPLIILVVTAVFALLAWRGVRLAIVAAGLLAALLAYTQIRDYPNGYDFGLNWIFPAFLVPTAAACIITGIAGFLRPRNIGAR